MTSYDEIEAECLTYLLDAGFPALVTPASSPWAIVSPEGAELAFPSGDGFGGRSLDSIPDGEIGRWLGHLAGWRAYASHLAGLNSAVKIAAESGLKRVRSVALASNDGKLTDRRIMADVDPEVAAFALVEGEADARARLLDGQIAAIDAMHFGVSRELTRRSQTQDREQRRSHNP